MRQKPISLEALIKTLPPEARGEARDFVEFLVEKRTKKNHGKPKFAWAGALRELKNKFTSVELQHEISKWRMTGE